ncbi:hypothetical protein GUY44_07565 [Pimelobacter simplex]|uniref:Uncharacterized protein n=1 Tax=Nocardioides simplex TaxID=2045 RepID=A0A0A1DF17_NOCSI|nr:hypothetical protein [Pimelobacter simplex]AIY15816.1 hypothetical protein KR76_01810 [Pimelobacter simplex]MCG8150332.1 hypothetical protein [Pimelobacter simplex]GEB16698.1 hypothetical protein NSI01_50130 [Pimelobacter simplex]SFM89852.1 hypothetical protein SAMN05421671_4086 [Pimelobacter simplex]
MSTTPQPATTAPETTGPGAVSVPADERLAPFPGTDAETFIQWKGTTVCLDFYCACGAHGHYDGDFAYAVRCPTCDAIYELGTQVLARRVEATTSTARLLTADTELFGSEEPC